MDHEFGHGDDEFEVIAQRRKNTWQSLALTALTLAACAYLVILDHKRPLFSGKGSDMGPVIILSFGFIGLMAGLFSIRRNGSFLLGVVWVVVVLGGVVLLG